MVQVGEDRKIKWSKLHYPNGDVGDALSDGQYRSQIPRE